MTHPCARRRALDQPRDVGEDELPFFVSDRAQDGIDGCEGIVGNLRPGVRQTRQERRLARVRKPDQAGVGEQPKLELDPSLLSGQALLGKVRRLPRRSREALVPMPTASPCRNHRALSRLHKVERRPVDTLGRRPWRNRNLQRLAASPMPARTLAMSPPPRLEMPSDPKRRQIPPRRITNEHHIAPTPTIATIRPTPRNMSLPAKRHDAIPPSPTFHPYASPIMKHEGSLAANEPATVGRPVTPSPGG